MKKNTVEVEIFHDNALQISANALYALFGKEKHETNALSPLFDLKPSEQENDQQLLEQLRKHHSFETLRAILLKPDIRIEHRYGGDNTGLTVFSTMIKNDIKETLVAFPNAEGSMIFRLYSSFQEYLHWRTSLLLSRVNNAVANFLPPPLSIPSFIYGLHAIDSYRRNAYCKALEFKPVKVAEIDCNTFNTTLAQSIASFDLRWLLSSFFVLTPDITDITFAPENEDLENLVRRTVIIPAKNDAGEKVFLFGEVGEYLGAEFLRSWELSIGISARRLVEGKVQSYYRAFIAPTALSNHLFQLESKADAVVINHQALTFANIIGTLEEKLSTLPPLEQKQASAPEEKEEQVSSTSQTCKSCKQQMPLTMKFCGNCGAHLDEKQPQTDPKFNQISPKEFIGLASALQQAHDQGKISESEFKAVHAQLKAKSPNGENWTVGLKSHDWFKESSGHWIKQQEPSSLLIDKELLAKIEQLKD